MKFNERYAVKMKKEINAYDKQFCRTTFKNLILIKIYNFGTL